MSSLESHPTVIQAREAQAAGRISSPPMMTREDLERLCRAAGADDCGFVTIDDPALDDQRHLIQTAYPFARTLISFVKRMHHEAVRSPMRSYANLEFHSTGDDVTDTAREIVRALTERGVRAGNANMAFPMEADQWPDRIWVVSHKPVAVAAGMGRMGIHRSVIHPKFGSFILLGTVVIDAEIGASTGPIDFNPCLECKLCVAACPTGAIHPDGYFNFSACYSHNYREFMGGFEEWSETIADAKNSKAFRAHVSDNESVSMWQTLSFGANYKAAYCIAACPAGEDLIGPYLNDRQAFVREVVKPLQAKVETIYVHEHSDAERHVARRYPHKRVKFVRNKFRLTTIDQFIRGMSLSFERHRPDGLNALYHFCFVGREPIDVSVEIRDKSLNVRRGLQGKPNLVVTADSETWLRILRKESSMPWALMRRKVKLQGSPRLLLAFARCFVA
ncbi:MAG: SCP2 sterol-binding domain-containing protein [Hyphomicrobium sp.]|nr:SCP2 sterol-binding domain-containing protein [Hyphomicrobium sp.]